MRKIANINPKVREIFRYYQHLVENVNNTNKDYIDYLEKRVKDLEKKCS